MKNLENLSSILENAPNTLRHIREQIEKLRDGFLTEIVAILNMNTSPVDTYGLRLGLADFYVLPQSEHFMLLPTVACEELDIGRRSGDTAVSADLLAERVELIRRVNEKFNGLKGRNSSDGAYTEDDNHELNWRFNIVNHTGSMSVNSALNLHAVYQALKAFDEDLANFIGLDGDLTKDKNEKIYKCKITLYKDNDKIFTKLKGLSELERLSENKIDQNRTTYSLTIDVKLANKEDGTDLFSHETEPVKIVIEVYKAF